MPIATAPAAGARLLRLMVGAVALYFGYAPTITAQQPVLQRGYDSNVSGANLRETLLNATGVGPDSFGLLFTLPVDEKVLAQPLYVPGLVMPNYGTANVVFVATMNDTVYAFDADKGGTPLWSVNLAALLDTTAPLWADFSNPPVEFSGHLGILSTPVIDPSTHIMYVVACTLENATMAYRLHAIDITTGLEPYGPAVLLTASLGGYTLSAAMQLQRNSLALSGNYVVFGFSGQQAERPGTYLGWVLAYDKTTLQQTGVFVPVVNNYLQGGVWQSGRPPAVDSAGYVYVFTGNSNDGGYVPMMDFSESVLKLDPSNNLSLTDSFTAGNWQYLDEHDSDLASSGPLLIPGTNLLTGGGKTGDLYVLDTGNLGGWTANDSQVVQSLYITPPTGASGIYGGPVYWGGSANTGSPLLYDWGSSDVLKAYPFDGSTFALNPGMSGTTTAVYPGGILALSANGNTPGTGILWATTPDMAPTGGNPSVPAALHAFNAENISQELWNTMMNPGRDNPGSVSHFVPPLIANGRVYLATGSLYVAVYGLLNAADTASPTSLAFGSQTIGLASAAQTVTVTNTSAAALSILGITITGTNNGQFAQTNDCASFLAIGASCKINVVFKPKTTGAKTAQVNVNVGAGAAQGVTLGGTGIAAPFTVLPTSLAFGSQTVGVASAAQAVTVTNAGAATLSITGITISGKNDAQFAQTNNCGASLPIGAFCTINVEFKPKTIGAKTAQLNISDGVGVTIGVTLGGTGATPPFTVAPTSLAFGDQITGVASAAQAVTVTNTGLVTLSIAGIAITGTANAQFLQTNDCVSSVEVGSFCTINVVFKPRSTGAKSEQLNVNAGAGGIQGVALSGTGTSP